MQTSKKQGYINVLTTEPTRWLLGGIASLLIGLFLYSTVLLVRIPPELGIAARYDFSLFLITAATLLVFAYRLQGWLGRTVSISLVLVLFALPLARFWVTGASDGYVIGGLLPISDANGIYFDARNLLEGIRLVPWGQQRPLFAGFLSVLLGMIQQNLQITLAILTIVVAISCFLIGREIQLAHGVFPGAFLTIGTFLYFRALIGQTSTESLGFPLGVLALTILLRSARLHQPTIAIAGIFLFSFALNVRIGAVFILPALLLWGALTFHSSSPISWRFLGLGFIAVLLAFTLNYLLIQVVYPVDSPPFGNFSFSLYGLLTNGNWATVFHDHPEVMDLTPSERVARAYDLSLQIIRETPMALVNGILRGWREFLIGNHSIFILDFSSDPKGKIDFVLRPLSCIGLVVCLKNPKQTSTSLILILIAGIFLSTPFVPIWDAGMRPYAATIAIHYLLAAVGVATIVTALVWFVHHSMLNGVMQRFQNTPELNQNLHKIVITCSNHQHRGISISFLRSFVLIAFGLLLCTLSFIGPIFIKFLARPSQISSPMASSNLCFKDQEAAYFRISRGSSINLAEDNSVAHTKLPNIRISDFKRGLDGYRFWFPEEAKGLETLEPSTKIADTYNYEWLILKPDTKLEQGLVIACGQREQFGQYLVLFKADFIKNLENP